MDTIAEHGFQTSFHLAKVSWEKQSSQHPQVCMLNTYFLSVFTLCVNFMN